MVLLGVPSLWHVAQWVSRAPPHHTLPTFLNLNYMKLELRNFFLSFSSCEPGTSTRRFPDESPNKITTKSGIRFQKCAEKNFGYKIYHICRIFFEKCLEAANSEIAAYTKFSATFSATFFTISSKPAFCYRLFKTW